MIYIVIYIVYATDDCRFDDATFFCVCVGYFLLKKKTMAIRPILTHIYCLLEFVRCV